MNKGDNVRMFGWCKNVRGGGQIISMPDYKSLFFKALRIDTVHRVHLGVVLKGN